MPPSLKTLKHNSDYWIKIKRNLWLSNRPIFDFLTGQANRYMLTSFKPFSLNFNKSYATTSTNVLCANFIDQMWWIAAWSLTTSMWNFMLNLRDQCWIDEDMTENFFSLKVSSSITCFVHINSLTFWNKTCEQTIFVLLGIVENLLSKYLTWSWHQ